MTTLNDLAKTHALTIEQVQQILRASGIDFLSNTKQLTKVQQAKVALLIQEHLKANVVDEKLDRLVKQHKIFIDTCSLVQPKAIAFLNTLEPALKKHNSKLIIPIRVIEELEKIQRGQTGEVVELSKAVCQHLALMQQRGVLDLRGEDTDNFADNVFDVVFSKFRLQYKLMLITQDKALAKEMLQKNSSQAIRGKTIVVQKIDRHGKLVDVEQKAQKIAEKTIPANERFQPAKQVTSVSDSLMNVQHIPDEFEQVYTTRGAIQLLEKLATGGEGSVYKTSTPYVAKIYKKEKLTLRNYEKIKRMLSKQVKCEGVCWPVEMLFNAKNEFVGFLMPEAKGKELQKTIFIKPLFLKHFPDWKKKDTVQLTLTILDKIQYLHQRNIILGDINPSNILVVSPKEVYFVDTDSYQIEEFPCPVGTVNFTAPEIQRKRFSDFLRTFEHENFAVATLLFMLMLPGKPPYSQQGGESPVENIINMDFSYPFGDNSNKKTPDGPWRFSWSHLPYDIKESFYKSFRKGEEYSVPAKRLRAGDWSQKFSKYLHLLETGKFAKQDPMSEELFPTRFKRVGSMKYGKCTLCKMEQPEESLTENICQPCLNDGDKYACKRCKNELTYTNYVKYVKKAPRFETCPPCHQELQKVHSMITCQYCYKPFPFYQKDYEFYKSKGFELPRRCSTCKQQGPQTPPVQPVQQSTPPPEQPRPRITSIVEYLKSRF
ncbi:protein kinase domain-containing protein [Caryophanon latum]|uniref:Protein kinase domain-containing protein n=1 Tax=Caryophanon latum TaxID=33977 RepID=A0A1C0YVA0_9BACL|nr:zinc-ribbon domain containing protein [Caryophanon latum]OCS91107.1 hypothetical protein A6K76_10205 [Caryophanon latum]